MHTIEGGGDRRHDPVEELQRTMLLIVIAIVRGVGAIFRTTIKMEHKHDGRETDRKEGLHVTIRNKKLTAC